MTGTPAQLALSRRRALMLGAAGFAVGGFSRPSRAAEYATSWKFGDVTVHKVLEHIMLYPADKSFPGMPLEELDANADILGPNFYDPASKGIVFSYQAYLVRTPRYNIIVDGGHGNDKKRGLAGTSMLHGTEFIENLRKAGVTPDQVHFVMNTHFDSDHTGWNTVLANDAWKPTFPKARYLFDKVELADVEGKIAKSAPSKAAYDDSIKPILDAGNADMIDGDHTIGDGVRIVASRGHTAGHHSLEISSKGKRAVLCGDVIHSPIEVVHPEWTVAFDHDKEAAKITRTKFVEANTDVDVTIFAAHFSGPTAGKIVSEKGKRRFRTLVT